MTEQTQQAETVTEAPAQQPTGIQIADLQIILNIIDLASSRGAFRANELTNIGAIADKLGRFLASVAEQQKQNEEANQAEASQSAEAPADNTPADASAKE